MNRVKQLREAKNWSQPKLAEELGKVGDQTGAVTDKTIRKWENGETIKSGDLINLREVFGVSIDYILGVTDYKGAKAEDIGRFTGLSPESCDFLISYRKYVEDRLQSKEDVDEHLEGFIASINYFLEEMGEQFTAHSQEAKFVEIDHLLDEIYHFIMGNNGEYHREERIQYNTWESERDSFYRLHTIEDELKERRKKEIENAQKSARLQENIRKEMKS